MRHLIYARVSPKGSTWSAAESSVPVQLHACRQYVLRTDPHADFIEVTDEFESGKNTRRPGFQRILADLEGQRGDWDALVVYSIDRLGRSIGDMLPFFESMHKAGRGLMAVRQNIDMNTAGGRAMLYLMCVFAQLEREMNSERTTAKMMSIAAAGGIPYGKAPYGYRRVEKSNVLHINPATGPVVARLFTDYAAGVPLGDLCITTGVPKSSVMQILRRQIYKGLIDYGGRTFPGRHEPLVTPDLWARAHARLPTVASPGKPSHRPAACKAPYLLAGLVKCHCGRSRTPYSVKKPTGARFHYYKCTDPMCGQASNAKTLDAKILAHVRAHPVTEAAITVMVDELGKIRAEQLRASVPRLHDIARETAEARHRLTSADDAFLTGIVTPANAAHWNQVMSEALQRLEALAAEEQTLAALQGSTLPDVAALTAMLHGWGELLDRADTDDTRRAFLQSRVSEVSVLPNRSIQLRLVMTNESQWLPRWELVITIAA